MTDNKDYKINKNYL